MLTKSVQNQNNLVFFLLYFLALQHETYLRFRGDYDRVYRSCISAPSPSSSKFHTQMHAHTHTHTHTYSTSRSAKMLELQQICEVIFLSLLCEHNLWKGEKWDDYCGVSFSNPCIFKNFASGLRNRTVRFSLCVSSSPSSYLSICQGRRANMQKHASACQKMRHDVAKRNLYSL